MPTWLARVVACVSLSALLTAAATAQPQEPVPAIVGMDPQRALEALDEAGFDDAVLRVDGTVRSSAEVLATKSVVAWTSPPEWMESDGSTKLEVGFETKVRVADHVGQTGGDAKLAAARIGYVLVEGDPSSGTPIPDGDTRIVDSFHSSSPPPGTLVSVGSYVGVILIAPAAPGFSLADAAIGALVGVVVGAAAATALGSKRASA